MPEKLTQYKDLYVPVSIIVAALIIGGALVYTKGFPQTLEGTAGVTPGVQQGEQTSAKSAGDNPQIPVTEQDHSRGNRSAAVTLIEFSDFQCPFCQRFHPTAKQALAEYGDKVRWVYKHFPIDSIHPHARPAAEASECIAEQKGNEGFWQFADALFENQSRLGNELYRELAQLQQLNMSQFDNCVASRKYKDKVEADLQLGIALGIQGTPGGFVNAQPMRGAIPYEQLKSMIDEELK